MAFCLSIRQILVAAALPIILTMDACMEGDECASNDDVNVQLLQVGISMSGVKAAGEITGQSNELKMATTIKKKQVFKQEKPKKRHKARAKAEATTTGRPTEEEKAGSDDDDDDDGPPECASTCQIDPNITPTCEDVEGYITGCASSCSKEIKLEAKREYCPREGTGQSEDREKGSDDDDDGPPECASTCQIDPSITPTCEDVEGYLTGCASSCPEEIKLEAKREFCPRDGTGQSKGTSMITKRSVFKHKNVMTKKTIFKQGKVKKA